MSSFCSAVHLASAACALAPTSRLQLLHPPSARRPHSPRVSIPVSAMQLLAEADSLPRHGQSKQPELGIAIRTADTSIFFSSAARLAAAPRFRRILSCASQSVSAVRLPAASEETSPSSREP